MKTPAEVITELGSHTAQGIAALLVSRDMKGEREDSTSCPLARYFHVETGLEEIKVELQTILLSSENKSLSLPQSAIDFIRVFDNGGLPELDLHPIELEDLDQEYPF